MKTLLFIWHINDWLMFYDFGGLVFPDLCSFKATQQYQKSAFFFYYSLTENNMKTLLIPKPDVQALLCHLTTLSLVILYNCPDSWLLLWTEWLYRQPTPLLK